MNDNLPMTFRPSFIHLKTTRKVNGLLLALACSLLLSQPACKTGTQGNANTNSTTASPTPADKQDGQTNGGQAPPSQEAQALFTQGIEHFKLDEDEAAAQAFEQAIKLEPDYGEAHFNLGLTYGSLGKKTEATEEYKAAVKIYENRLRLEPKDADTQYNLGEAQSKLGEFDKAVDAYKQAVKLKREDDATYYALGTAYSKLAKYQEAVAAFQKAVDFDPNNFRASDALDKAQQDLDRQRSMLENAKRQFEQSGKNSNARGNANGNTSIRSLPPPLP